MCVCVSGVLCGRLAVEARLRRLLDDYTISCTLRIAHTITWGDFVYTHNTRLQPACLKYVPDYVRMASCVHTTPTVQNKETYVCYECTRHTGPPPPPFNLLPTGGHLLPLQSRMRTKQNNTRHTAITLRTVNYPDWQLLCCYGGLALRLRGGVFIVFAGAACSLPDRTNEPNATNRHTHTRFNEVRHRASCRPSQTVHSLYGERNRETRTHSAESHTRESTFENVLRPRERANCVAGGDGAADSGIEKPASTPLSLAGLSISRVIRTNSHGHHERYAVILVIGNTGILVTSHHNYNRPVITGKT